MNVLTHVDTCTLYIAGVCVEHQTWWFFALLSGYLNKVHVHVHVGYTRDNK